MDKKIIALDLDDTLLSTDKTISEVNINALQELLDAGHYVAIDTGRPIHGIKKILGDYDVFNNKNVFYLGYQGAVGYHPHDDSVFFSDLMDSAKVVSLIDSIRAAGINAMAFDDEKIYTFDGNQDIFQYNTVTNEPFEYIKDTKELLDKNICKCMAISFEYPHTLLDFQKVIDPQIEGDFISMFSTPYFLEFINKTTGKGSGLSILAEKLGVEIENTVACGDERNDISMIKAAGVGVAVCNGQQVVRDSADYITENDNDHGAIAEVIYKFILNK